MDRIGKHVQISRRFTFLIIIVRQIFVCKICICFWAVQMIPANGLQSRLNGQNENKLFDRIEYNTTKNGLSLTATAHFNAFG